MAECGICLDVLRNPVCVPCGHVQCERCLRAHISSGTDALKSTCPTCRKPFHTAIPDFTFVPQKFHDFILPCVRKIYMDIPSVITLRNEIHSLTQRLESSTKENEHLRARCIDYRNRLETTESEKRTITENEEEAREEADKLRKKYESLKRKYWDVQSGCSENSVTSSEIFPKEEEHPVSLHDLNAHRRKRALPKPRGPNMRRKSENASQLVKRQRTNQCSDAGSSSQLLDAFLKYENEDD